MKRRLLTAAALVTVISVGGCDPCAGTPNCHVFSKVSVTGQFVSRKTGERVGGVQVEFTRESGRETQVDPIRTVSDDQGYFTLHTATYGDGGVTGILRITPPPPWSPYEVRNFTMQSHIVRGDGNYLGQLVVDPYIFMIGEFFDRRRGTIVPNARLTLKRTGGVMMTPDSVDIFADDAGNFTFGADVSTHGVVEVDAVLTTPYDAEPFRFKYLLKTEHRQTAPFRERFTFPRLAQWVVEFSRRGTGIFVPGVRAKFVWTGGVHVVPEVIEDQLTEFGRLAIFPTPEGDGEFEGKLIVMPPNFPTETIPLKLRTHYEDTVFFAGVFGYGPHVFVEAQIVNRATNAPISGAAVTFKRVGGLPKVEHPAAEGVDMGVRTTDAAGVATYIVGAPDSGQMIFDLETLIPGGRRDTIRGVTVPAHYRDSPTRVGPFPVGPPLSSLVRVQRSP